MENKVRWLQAISFQKPRQQRAPGELRTVVAGKPPIVLLVLGEFMTLRGLIFGVNANWAPPYHNESAQPYGAKVDLVFQRVSGFYPDFYSQKKGMTRLSASTTATGGPNVEGRVVVG
jgi:hypothetical protein